MNTRSRRGEKIGMPKPMALSDSSAPSSSASSESEDEQMEEDEELEVEQAKDTAASLDQLQLESDEDEGPPIGAMNDADGDLESIPSTSLFRSEDPPPAIPSTSRGFGSAAGHSGPRVVAANANLRDSSRDMTVQARQRGSARNVNASSVASPTPPSKKNIRKQYSDLIQKCQEFEDKEGFDESMETIMSTNIGRGQELLDQVAGGPGDMLLAFLHTRICSGMIKTKTLSIGSNTSAFKVELFLQGLLDRYHSTDGTYVPREAVKQISSGATDCCKTVNPIMALVGSFDRHSLHGQKEKEKKQRAQPRKRQFDETMSQSTQHELVDYTAAERVGSQKQANQESFSKEILKVLKRHHQASGKRNINLFEFTMDKASFASTLGYLFYVAFLVRDGDVCMFREDGQANHDYTISVKPAKPPEKNTLAETRKKKKRKKDSERSQFILSFSMKRFKELGGMATGEDIISEHRRQMNLNQGED